MNKIKNYFLTPRQTIMTLIKVFIIVICIGVGTIYTVGAVTEKTSIGSENAKNFAFVDAGVDPVDATNVKVDFEYKQGTFVYEVEFEANGVEYEYYIKASDGSIVKKESEIINITKTTDNYISLDEAKNIALEDVNLDESDVTFTEAKLDSDDIVYDIEFYTTTYEYDYEINATTGTIVSKSVEERVINNTTSSSSSSTTSSNNITLAKAKSIALSDAGLKESEVTFTKTKLDKDDGISIYDIEFYTDTYEYDYEINATTGTIIEKDKESIEVSSSNSSYIGVDKAKSIAVNKAGLTTSSVTFTKTKLEKDDGIMVYEIEFYKDGIEYECTINAITGSIIEYDYDYD